MNTPQSTDLVAQLRVHATDTAWVRDSLMHAAATEIERLRKDASSWQTAAETITDVKNERIEKLEDALAKAVEVIRVWHNMGGNESVWDIYWRNAPEMKPIREAVSALEKSHAG